MDFASDNAAGVAPEIMAALAATNRGSAAAYGADSVTDRMTQTFAEIFEREVAVFPVATGTAANALALAALTPPWGIVYCHEDAHVAVDECGAPEFFSHGAKLVPLEGAHGKLAPDTIEQALKHYHKGFVHHSQPSVVSLTQATERGTVYSPEEVTNIAKLAKEHGMKLHVDGARFANALVHLGRTPAEATWKIGIDALSFGATKNGALCAEAVIFFDPKDVRDFEYRRKKSGHLLSKMRFVSAQFLGYLREGLWLANAARANRLAKRLADGLARIECVEIAHPVEANAVFAYLPNDMIARLRKSGARFYDWAPPGTNRTLARFVLSFATPDEDVERFLAIARG